MLAGSTLLHWIPRRWHICEELRVACQPPFELDPRVIHEPLLAWPLFHSDQPRRDLLQLQASPP
eukprot:5020670-Prorocentrum_lima.AAC.1